MTKEEITRDLNLVQSAIAKHRNLAMWGNVESIERLRVLRKRKKELQDMLTKTR